METFSALLAIVEQVMPFFRVTTDNYEAKYPTNKLRNEYVIDLFHNNFSPSG